MPFSIDGWAPVSRPASYQEVRMNPSPEMEKRFQVSRNLGLSPSLEAFSPAYLGILNLFNKTKSQRFDLF